MDQKLRDAWATDLESGNFTQCSGSLHRIEPEGLTKKEQQLKDNRAGWCCLGVLSPRIARLKKVKETGWVWQKDKWIHAGIHGDSDVDSFGFIPSEVCGVIGLGSGAQQQLSDLNDGGAIGEGIRAMTFKGIAKIVRKQDLTDELDD
jgi:hypothetical protein